MRLFPTSGSDGGSRGRWRAKTELLRKQLRDGLALPWEYVSSARTGSRQRELFDGVHTYCMFIGYPRSGSSLVGSLLSAHPDVVIAHQLQALRYVRLGFRRDQLYHLILQSDRRFTQAGRRARFGYEYTVPDEWQGRFRELRVIGDKAAGLSTSSLRRHPELLSRLRRTTGARVRVIHVMRNPYDNITTIARRSATDLDRTRDRYFSWCRTVADISDGLGADVFHLRHELFVADPTTHLRDLCSFLGVEASEDYLSHCAATVNRSPHQSREEGAWDRESIDEVATGMRQFEFLRGYGYKD